MSVGQLGDSEQERIIKALHLALKMETDGKEFYHEASLRSVNELGKELFQKLAAEEDKHGQKFQEIYQTIRQKKAWPALAILPAAKDIRTIFSQVRMKAMKITASPQEFNAIDTAMDMEDRSHKYYQEQAHKSVGDAAREFYQSLAAEERGHYLALTDYREYLRNPAGWFTVKEHPSLDGV